MPQTVEWLQEGKIILSKISGVLTIDEIRETSPLYVQMLDAGSAPVHIITGMQGLVLYPTNLLQLKDAMPSLNHPSMGWQVFYGAPPLARSLINVFSTITRSDFSNFRSLEQAVAFLHEKDAAVKLLVP